MRFPHTVILANGSFPTAELPLEALHRTRRIVCCDGAAETLVAKTGLEPTLVVGDLDSLAEPERFADRLVRIGEQATNDLAKAYRVCLERHWHEVLFLGITGKREDHTLGNLAHLVDFAEEGVVSAWTDEGIFTPVLRSTQFASFPGQQVSIFSFDSGVTVYSEGLRYPLDGVVFDRWWRATLNESLGEGFKLVFDGGPLLVFQTYRGGAV